MNRRPLGRSGLSVAPLALGTNVFGWSVDEAGAFAVLDAFVDAGLDLLDTADAYPAWVPGNEGGESETMIGRWLARSGKRDRVVVATKVAKWARHPGLSPANIEAAADDSLRRLGIDTIDLYFAHEDDAGVPLADTLGAFSRLIERGKVRAIGASNYTAARFAEALATSARLGLPRYEVLQPEYNLVARKEYEASLAPLVQDAGVGVVCYYALASGFLTGKYRSEDDLGKSAARGRAAGKYLNGHGLRVLAALDDVARRHDATPAQVALAWAMARPGITAPIASATTPAQVAELAGAVRLRLSDEDMRRLDVGA
ncbi:aldo/keto reductase [Dokdonella fugitiva]|jgi:aryl-alcohol dehydrogenase-like predicted oxidoreductase|uniref:aldo/keto reductase n=1 Tax=Dokdonella fugitiva TaxID=328517 RepID=UPI0015FB642A|nr:aldo/keto reductase [Dokdonella fugitiva]MBA8883702.1 aryl-alcohol dehydrogenase-like predicted oxidoreductase [Dokdonella fugitiva]